MKTKLVLNLAVCFSVLLTNAYAATNLSNCRVEETNPLNTLQKNINNCQFQAKIVDFEKVKEEHRKTIYAKLAQKLTTQINQNSEELGLLTSFFNANNQDLSMNSPEVKNKCQLENLKAIENCGGKKTDSLHAMKLEMLMKNLKNGTNSKSKFGEGLYGVLAEKYVSNLGLSNSGNSESLQCPIEGSAGSFILQSQLDDLSAEKIINDYLISNEAGDSNNDSYAQLKMIKNTNNPAFIEKFKDYVRKKPKTDTAKKRITDFFLDKENQKILAPSLASQCDNINKNINKFLCSDLDEIGSLNTETSTKLFNGLDVGSIDDQFGVDKEDPLVITAYGFQCMAQAKSTFAGALGASDGASKEQTVDGWYKDFTNNTRPEGSDKTSNGINKTFCDNYTCQSDKSKENDSCKTGGPLSSKDLATMMGCLINPRGDKCDSLTLKSVDYMASLEKIKASSGLYVGNSGNSSSPDNTQIQKVKSSLPDFAENYLGVQGSLIALGKPVTEVTIAEKTQDFKERNLNTNPPAYNPPNGNVETRLAGPTTNNAPIIQDHSYNYSDEGSSSPTKAIKGVRSSKTSVADSSNSPEITGPGAIVPKTNSLNVNDNNKSAKSETTSNATSANATQPSAIDPTKIVTSNPFDSWAKRLADKESTLNARENLADSRDSEYWRRESELRAREAELAAAKVAEANSGNKEKTAATATTKSEERPQTPSRSEIAAAKLKQEIADLNASPSGLIVTPEKLDKLQKKDLTKYGVNVEEPFVISVRLKGKLIHVRVAKVSVKGKTFLAPRLNEDNEEIKEAVLKSPLFKEFRYYFEKEHSTYFPVK